ncbi:MAG: hypothetical protein ACYDEX_23740 [Mobilitalea sp.]
MKLKYYMRGLGIGIILATLLLTIANPKEKLSNEEIIARASKLGMVEEESENDYMDEVLEDIKPTEALIEQLTGTPAPELTPEPSPEPTIKPTQAPTPKPTPTNIPAKIKDEPEDNNNSKVTFTVQSGMSSGQVAALLVEKGLIDNAEDFNQYIVEAGKASVIRVGTYTVPQDATYEDIMIKMTTK